MKIIFNKVGRHLSLFLVTIFSPFLSRAESFNVNEQTQGGNGSLYAEIAIGVIFVAAVTVFLTWKAKHDKKVREKQMEQMKKVAASKRRAA